MDRLISNEKILKVTAFFIILIVIFVKINYILRDKNECENIFGFNYETKDSIDVVFLGSSQVLVSMNPMQMWHDYGIVSYNCATSATNIPMMYYSAKLAIEKQHPKVMVIDVSFINDPSKYLGKGTERMHAIWDNFYLDLTKYEAVTDLMDKKDWLEMVLPLYLYHSRWDKIGTADFKEIEKDNSYKGFVLNDEHVQPQSIAYNGAYSKDRLKINDTARTYFEKLINMCENNHVQVVLTALPCPYLVGNVSYEQALNTLKIFSEEKEIPLLNGMEDKELWGINYHTDFCDIAHVNFRGSEKISKIVGDFLKSNYVLADHRGENEYKSFDEEYERYIEYMDSHCKYKCYSRGTKIDFVSWGQNTFFCNGPWPSNGLYSWSGGRQNDAFFYLDGDLKGGDLSISFELGDVFLNGHLSQMMDVYFNNKFIQSIEIDGKNCNQKITCKIDAALINTEVNHLTVKYPNVKGDVISANNHPSAVKNPFYCVGYKYIYID